MSRQQLREQSRVRKGVLILALLLALPAGGVQAADQPPLILEKTIALPGVKGRIDHMAVDTAGQRLFVAALGNNTLEVIDLSAGQRLHTIAGLSEPQGVCYVSEFKKIFVANGGDGSLRIFDGGSFKLVDTISFSSDADNLRYDSQAKLLYVGYGNGALGIVEAQTGKRLGEIRLAAHPEAFQLEQAGPRIYVNIPSTRQVVVVDRQKLAVVATWPVPGAHNFPMTLDEANHRLFIGCRTPPKIVIYDTESGKPVGGLDIAGDVDDLFCDGQDKRLYASCGAGWLEVFQQTGPDHYARIAKLPTLNRARTSLLVPELRRLFLAAPANPGQEAEIRVYRLAP